VSGKSHQRVRIAREAQIEQSQLQAIAIAVIVCPCGMGGRNTYVTIGATRYELPLSDNVKMADRRPFVLRAGVAAEEMVSI
jgi:hypothetical protein